MLSNVDADHDPTVGPPMWSLLKTKLVALNPVGAVPYLEILAAAQINSLGKSLS